MIPEPGDVVLIGRAASVQFTDEKAIRLRVISVCPRPTYEGWLWLTGYVLDPTGAAVARREVYVQHAGLRLLRAAKTPPRHRRAGAAR